jgi:hypothetical protein
MLIEQPPATTRHTVPKWLWIAGALFFGGIAASIVLLAINWPFTQDAMTKALEEASGRPVQIRNGSRKRSKTWKDQISFAGSCLRMARFCGG